MRHNRLILHIGAPKCGSTALQTAWSHTPELSSASGEKLRYAIIDSRGKVVQGPELRRRAIRAMAGCAVSENITPLCQLPAHVIDAIPAALNLALERSSVILSQESWLFGPHEFETSNILQRINAPIDVLVYVRPQADWLNASWWQWGAWQETSLDAWEARQDAHWGKMIANWRALPSVRTVYARLLPNDIVSDFCSLVGAATPQSQVANKSLPGAALRFLQRRRELRPATKGVEIHFVLGRALEDSNEGTPWVAPMARIEHIVRAAKPDNDLLRSMLDADSQQKMDADLRWWDASAYASKNFEAPGPQDLNGEAMEDLAVALAKRLLHVEKQLAAQNARERGLIAEVRNLLGKKHGGR